MTRTFSFVICSILVFPVVSTAATGTTDSVTGKPVDEKTIEANADQSSPPQIELDMDESSRKTLGSDTNSNLSIKIDKPTIAPPKIDTESTALGTLRVTPQLVLKNKSIADALFKERDALGVVNVIGTAQMSRIGASVAIDALKRVSGVTANNGKFIVIRGQPERYTYTLWNGSPLPSPDPIKRIVPLDLFPTGILESVVVQKSYTADRPGAFAGGLVAMNTREAPDDAFLKIAVEGGYNTASTGEDGLVYDGGDTDFLGFDDGTRSLPDEVAAVENVSALPANQRAALGQTFLNNWAVEGQSLLPDFGLTLAGGKGFETDSGEFGVMGVVSYDRDARLRDTVLRSFAIGANGELVEQSELQEQTSDINTGTVAFLTVNGKWGLSSITSNTFYVHRTTDRVNFTSGRVTTSDARFVRRYLSGWYERELQAQQFLGEHFFKNFTLNWRAMRSQAGRNVPDQRTYTYRRRPDGEFVFFADAAAIRRYSFNEDKVTSLGADAEFPLALAAWGSFDLTVGADYYDQSRDAGTRRFRFDPQFGPGTNPAAPVEVILAPGNIGNSVDFFEVTLPNDSYNGTATVTGVYLQGDLHLSDDWRIVAGVRNEQADFEVNTAKALGGGQEQVTAGFDKSVLLPSLAVTWSPVGSMQYRLTASKTVSRPNLNELSPATYFDLDTGFRYVGNPDLKPTSIQSVDLRWQWFLSPDETVSIGFFTKIYDNPLETSYIPSTGGEPLRQVVNADSAQVQGIEIGARSSVNRIARLLGVDKDWMDGLYLRASAAVIDSSVEVGGQSVATQSKRPLQGQADTVLNLAMGYNGTQHDVTVTYSRVGERLVAVGTYGRPGVYRQPTPLLNINYLWQAWEDGSLQLKIENLLDPSVDYTQGSKVQRSWQEGRTISLEFEWTFN